MACELRLSHGALNTGAGLTSIQPLFKILAYLCTSKSQKSYNSSGKIGRLHSLAFVTLIAMLLEVGIAHEAIAIWEQPDKDNCFA